ncbi:MAG: hypothetical protein EA404_08775 [Spirochaetaceae bacterium]|nr:MAG: hypothetical protein EA404_08775 [Spirochaetaceae bacterium]
MVVKSPWVTLALCLVTLCVGAPLAIGDTADGFARPRFMLLLLETESDRFTDQQEFVLYSSILTTVAAASDAVVIFESPDPDIPPTRAGKESLARSVNADSILHIIASGGFENLTVEYEAVDLLRRQTAGVGIIRPGFSVDYRVISVGLWSPLELLLRNEFQRVVDQTELTVEAKPGAMISGLPGREMRVGESGRLTVAVPSSSAYSLTAELPGHYRENASFFVSIDPVSVEFDLVQQPTYGVDLRFSSLQFPGVRFWYYAIPATLFVRSGITTQLYGFFPIDNSDRLLRKGSALSFLALDAGVYLLPPERLFRLYAGAGGYLRFVHSSLSELTLDSDAARGAMTMVLGGEYSTSRRWRFIFEYQPAYIFAPDPQHFIDLSFITNRFPDGEVPGFVLLDRAVLDLRNIYLGVRLDF